jgi:glycosyltransferase involved in cell wall biosynthesis
VGSTLKVASLKMRILYLSQLLPYPTDAGPKVRIYHVLQYLKTAGHDVTLVAFRRKSDKSLAIDNVREFCVDIQTVLMNRSRARDAWQLVKSLSSTKPFLIGRDSVTTMHAIVRDLLNQRDFDAIHADQLWMAQYALAINKQNNQKITTVLDQHNAVHLIPQRLMNSTSNPVIRAILSLEARKMARYEAVTCKEFDQVVWVTKEDREAVKIHQMNGKARSDHRHDENNNPSQSIIPICVDTRDKGFINRRPEARRVTFLGGLHWPPNADGVRWFAREIWPQIHREAPEAIFTIIGKDPPSTVADQLSRNMNIEVTGYVSDLIPYLEETAAFIVPLRAGGGMRVKILDAWSWGLPVVSTQIGAEGIDFVDGQNILIVDRAEQFAKAVLETLRMPSIGMKLGNAGRETVESLYDWRIRYRAWDAIYSP